MACVKSGCEKRTGVITMETTPNPEQTVGERIRKIRKGKKLTVKALAQKAGISANYVNMIEHNRRNPSRDVIDEIAAILNTTTEYLREGKGEPVRVAKSETELPAVQTHCEEKEPSSQTINAHEVQMILYLLKIQKPAMFPNTICEILNITQHELYLMLDGKPVDCPLWPVASKLLLLHVNKQHIVDLFNTIIMQIDSAADKL